MDGVLVEGYCSERRWHVELGPNIAQAGRKNYPVHPNSVAGSLSALLDKPFLQGNLAERRAS